MKKNYLYKKWNFLTLLNKLVIAGFFIYTKKVVFLHFNINKILFFLYKKKKKYVNTRLEYLRKQYNWRMFPNSK